MTRPNIITEKITIGTGVAVGNSIIDTFSVTKGTIPAPRMTTIQRNAIDTPVEGIQIYNLDTHKINYYGTSWIEVESSAGCCSLVNRKIVGSNGDFSTLKDAVDWFNASATENIEIILDAGNFDVDDTIIVNNSSYTLHLRGLHSSSTYVNAATGLTGKPMFNLKSECVINDIYFDGSTLADYGTLANENCFSLTTNSEVYYEFQNLIIDTFKIGIADLIGSTIWEFNFTISNCGIGTQINYSTESISTFSDIEIGNFENCLIGIDLLKGTGDNFLIAHCAFLNEVEQIGIQYTGGAGNYILGNFSQILNCNFNRIGTFASGFNFTQSDGRDANVVIIGCPNVADKKPHLYIEVLDSSTLTTITTSNTWTKATWDANDNTILCKIGNPSINRFVYQPDNIHDINISISLSLETDTGAPNDCKICIAKNGTINGNNELTAYDEIQGIMRSRLQSNDDPYPITMICYFENIEKNDYFEIFVQQDNIDNIRITNLTCRILTI